MSSRPITPPSTYLSSEGYKIDRTTTREAVINGNDDALSKLDLAQRVEEKLARLGASNNVCKRWLFEIICCCVSAACMLAIAIIYLRIHNTPLYSGEKALMVVNVLGKVASASLIVPISEALGQLKWTWFNKSNAMWDFEIFDKASRGPIGAILLLFRTRGRSLAALGAVLIVLLLAIDTFFQQVPAYQERWTQSHIHGSIPRIVTYQPSFTPSFKFGWEIAIEDKALASIAREFFYYNGTQPVAFGNGTRPDIPLSCPTSNCTWPVYETLAVCGGCQEVSARIDIGYQCLNTTIEWSSTWQGPLSKVPYPSGIVCGHFLNATSKAPILLSGFVQSSNSSRAVGEALLVRAIPLTDWDTKLPFFTNGSIAYKDVRYPILDGLIASVRAGSRSVYSHDAPYVHECMLSWCVQTIESSYALGRYDERVISTHIEAASERDPWPWSAHEVPVGTWLTYNESIVVSPPPSSSKPVVRNSIYQISNTTMQHAMNFFDDFFPSFYTAGNASAEPWLRYRNYAGGPMIRRLNFNPWQHPNNITRHMERLAQAMSNAVRSSSSKEMLQGNAYQTESFIKVSWGWLAFPFTLLLLSVIFLASTIVKTSPKKGQAGLWKNSAIPGLIYALPEETRSRFTADTQKGVRRVGRGTRIMLSPNIGWRVSDHNHSARSSILPK